MADTLTASRSLSEFSVPLLPECRYRHSCHCRSAAPPTAPGPCHASGQATAVHGHTAAADRSSSLSDLRLGADSLRLINIPSKLFVAGNDTKKSVPSFRGFQPAIFRALTRFANLSGIVGWTDFAAAQLFRDADGQPLRTTCNECSTCQRVRLLVTDRYPV